MAFNLNIERKESVNKCVRFPMEVITEIDKIIAENNVSFSKFVIEACIYALKDIEEQKKTNNEEIKIKS